MKGIWVGAMVLLASVAAAEGEKGFRIGAGDMAPSELAKYLQEYAPEKEGKKPVVVLHLVNSQSELSAKNLRATQEFIWEPMKKENLVVMAVAVGDSAESAEALAKRAGAAFPIVPDADKAVGRALAETNVPRTLIFDQEGRLAYQHKGFRSGREGEFRLAAMYLLDGEPVPVELKERRYPVCGEGAGGEVPTGVDPQLYAKNIIGEEAPEVPVETWINPMPDAEGKYVLVDFWATWCGPCIYSMKIGEEVIGKFSDKLVTMAVSDEPAEEVEAFVKEAGWKQPIGVDTQARAKEALGVMAIPHALLINPEGKVIWQGNPLMLWPNDGAMLRELLEGKD